VLIKPMEFARGTPDRADARPIEPIDPAGPRPTRLSHFSICSVILLKHQSFPILLIHFATISDIMLQCTQLFFSVISGLVNHFCYTKLSHFCYSTQSFLDCYSAHPFLVGAVLSHFMIATLLSYFMILLQ
jgi:hypothetical protein